MKPPSLMIFAAGFGTRMGPLTRGVPKPMLPLGGRPMIDHTIRIGREAGVEHIVANTHYLADQIEPHMQQMGVTTLREDDEILDTGGGLKAAAKHLTSPTFTLNPDALWRGPNPLMTLLAQWDDRDSALVLVVPLSRARFRRGGGDFALNGDRLSRGGDAVYTGAQLIRPDVVTAERSKVFSLNITWDRLIASERLRAVEYPGEWLDIGTEANLADANMMLEADDV